MCTLGEQSKNWKLHRCSNSRESEGRYPRRQDGRVGGDPGAQGQQPWRDSRDWEELDLAGGDGFLLATGTHSKLTEMLASALARSLGKMEECPGPFLVGTRADHGNRPTEAGKGRN